MKKFFYSLVLCIGLMCAFPQTISATTDNNGSGKEITVTHDKQRNITIIVVKDNGNIESITIRDGKGNIVYTDKSKH